MTVYFMGGEVGAFTPADANSGDSATASFLSFNSSFCRGMVYTNGSVTSITSAEISVPDTFWFHADISNRFSSGTYYYPAVFSVSGTDVFRIGIATTTIKLQALVAAVWTDIGSPVTVDFGATSSQTVDVYVEGNNASGAVKLYLSGTNRLDTTANLTAVTGIDALHMAGGGSARGLSQCVIADEPTVGWRLLTRYPNGNGATVDWTGDWSGIDEIPYSDASFINSATNGQIELCTQTGDAITGYVPRAVGVYARAKCGVSGPQNLQIGIRVSGSNYFSSDKALDIGYLAYGEIWNQNPATSSEWLSTQIDAIQIGVKAVT